MPKEDDYSTKIKKFRMSRNISQRRFGERIGVSGKTISSYETGRSRPPFRVLEKMESTYDVWFVLTKKKKKVALKDKLNRIQKVLEELALTLDC